jgi:hypothetical protein
MGLLLALAFGTGCGDNQDEEGARRLLARVREEGYRHWDRAPGWPSRRASSGPHADSVDIFVNDVIAEVLAVGEPRSHWPEGSIVVKDGYDGSELELIAIMEKRKNGWYWAEFDSEGDPDYSGHPDLCIDGHRDGSDSMRGFRLP